MNGSHPRWEMRRIQTIQQISTDEALADGWEPFAVANDWVYFRRPITPKPAKRATKKAAKKAAPKQPRMANPEE